MALQVLTRFCMRHMVANGIKSRSGNTVYFDKPQTLAETYY
jgi:hypothetical protein